jgi:2,3-dihydroxybiphenyl 1,2-dioxygenase
MGAKVSVSELGYIGIDTQNVDGWTNFLGEITGMQVSDKDEDGKVYIRMDERYQRFILQPSDHDDVAYFGLMVQNEDELDAVAAQVEEAGIKVTPGTNEEIEARHALGMVRFTDPGGMPLEIYYGAARANSPYYPSRASAGFKTENMGLGHGVLHYPDIKEAVKFYRDVLGFRISDIGGVGAFMHCNPRHHSVAIFGMRPGMKTRMNHFMVQYNELDDVGLAFDIAQQRGEKFHTPLGRHPNDLNISFYMFNPSGWHTECAWGARNVDDNVWETETMGAFGRPGEPGWSHFRHAEFEAGLVQSGHGPSFGGGPPTPGR